MLCLELDSKKVTIIRTGSLERMDDIRRAKASDARAVASLLFTELPKDPLLTLFSRATVLEKFIESLICSNRTWVIERNNLIGVISVGSLNDALDDFKRRTTFRDRLRILRAAAHPSQLPKLIGGLFYIVRKPKAPSQLEITWIAIDQSMHGKGLGGELLNVAVTSIFQKSGIIWVKTLVSTPENLRFYQKHHFEISHHVGGRVILTRSLGDSTCIQ